MTKIKAVLDHQRNFSLQNIRKTSFLALKQTQTYGWSDTIPNKISKRFPADEMNTIHVCFNTMNGSNIASFKVLFIHFFFSSNKVFDTFTYIFWQVLDYNGTLKQSKRDKISPTRRACPLSCSNTRETLDICSIANLNITKRIGALLTKLYSSR